MSLTALQLATARAPIDGTAQKLTTTATGSTNSTALTALHAYAALSISGSGFCFAACATSGESLARNNGTPIWLGSEPLYFSVDSARPYFTVAPLSGSADNVTVYVRTVG